MTWGSTVYLAMKAAEDLEKEGSSVEVIDLRTISPWDSEMVFESVKKTNRLLIAHEDSLTMGFGAEVSARVADECFDWLDAPIGRVGAMDCFVPAAPNLEQDVLPSAETVRAGAEKVLRY